MRTSFQRVSDDIRARVALLAAALAPAEDWQPVLFLDDGEQSGELGLLGCDPRLLADAEGRERLLRTLLPALIADTGAVRVGLTATVLSHTFLPGGVPAAGPVEQVQVLVADAARCDAWYAPITRRPGQHPLLGAFTARPGPLAERTFVADFAAAVAAALRA